MCLRPLRLYPVQPGAVHQAAALYMGNSMDPCAMSGHRIAAGAVMLLCISAVTGLFLRLIRHHPTEIASRFLCDAVTYTYHALVCNVLSYQVLRRAAGARWPVQLVLLLILLLGIAGMALAVRRSIRCGRYSASADGPVSMALPVIGGTVGLFAAKLLLPPRTDAAAVLLSAILRCPHWVLASAR